MELKDYYNRYDRSKNWKEILFLAKRAIQSAEFNELQKIIRDDFRVFANTLYNDGNLLEGGQIRIENETIYLTAGRTLYRGYVVDFSSAEIPLKTSGTQVVGLAIQEKIITEIDDPTLRNPAVGAKAYNEPGAYRLVITARWTDSEHLEPTEQFYPIYTIVDGVLQSSPKSTPEMEIAQYLLERYDAEANGNYAVDDFSIIYEGQTEDGKIIISVGAGKAHVQGKEVVIPYAQRIYLEPPTDTASVTAEPLIFTADGTYPLRYTPIARVTSILGVKQVTENVVHGNYVGAKDRLPNTPVLKVLEVRQGNTVYQEGVDYQVTGDLIDWSLQGAEPEPGSTYTVTYQYQTTSIPVTITEDRTAIQVSGLAQNTTFYVSYEYYIPRIDRIVLTPEKKLLVKKGTPSAFDLQPPQVTEGLSLAQVKLTFGTSPEITLEYPKAFRMSDFQNLLKEISKIKYNLSLMALKEEARYINLNAKDIFVDPFTSDRERDQGVPQDALCDNGTLRQAITWSTLQVRSGPPILLPPQEEKLVINNSARSTERRINQFQYASPPAAQITVTPAEFRFIVGTIWQLGWGGPSEVETSSQPVPQTTLRITGGKFNANEEIEIYLDGRLIETTTADANGNISAQVTTPQGLISGSKLIKVVGKTSKAEGQAIWRATAVTRILYISPCWCCGCWWRWWWDPVAQTFRLSESAYISAIELHFPKKPADWVQVTIMGTTVGLPDAIKTIYTQRFTSDQLKAGWNKLVFNVPVRLEADEEYALVIESASYEDTISTARLGQWDQENRRWITTQTLDGVFLTSANRSTWTPVQEEDLSLKMYKATFKPQATVELGSVTVENATDLVLLCDLLTPHGTNITLKATLVNRDETIILHPYIPVKIAKYSGPILFEAEFSTTNLDVSPVLSGNIQLSVGTVSPVSTYVSRYFSTRGSNLTVYLNCKEGSKSRINVYYRSGTTWQALTRNLSQAREVGNGYVEIPFTATLSNLSQTQLKIELVSTDTNLLDRPEAQNLRAIVS